MKFTFMYILILCVICGFTYAQKPFFRKDYSYNHNTRSFYKIHTIRENWQDAKNKCQLEGSSLLYPEDETEANVIANLMSERTQNPVYVGGLAWLSNGVYETIHGVPVSNFYEKWAPDEPSGEHYHNCITFNHNSTLADVDCGEKYPFICKKSAESVQWDSFCNMTVQGYQYVESVGRCYKLHVEHLDWPTAYAVCSAELSYLAVIDSQAEANVLVNITESRSLFSPVLVGFHDRYAEGWMTIKGVPLRESGYSAWINGEPAEYLRDGRRIDRCGSMLSGGLLQDVRCVNKLNFICEHEIDSY